MTTWEIENAANVHTDAILAKAGHTAPAGVDPIATMTPEMYRMVKAQLTSDGMWHGGK